METTPVSASTRTLKVRTSKAADTSTGKPAKAVTVKRKPKTLVKPESDDNPVNTGEMIATAAYYIAQQRNFAPGNELSDWLMAEQQVLAAHAAKS